MADNVIIANWKSNKTLTEALVWIDAIKPIFHPKGTVVLCPPYPFLVPLYEKISKTKLRLSLGVQDLSPFPAGAYTGAVTARNLEEIGVRYAILGHSERRRYFRETNQDVANKVTTAVAEGLIPIVCVDRDNVLAQSNAIDTEERKKCIVAFEPAEHIGTGTSDTLEDVLKVAEEIRKAFGTSIRVLYGGSTDPSSASTFLQSEKLNGLLVGGASLDPKSFASMV